LIGDGQNRHVTVQSRAIKHRIGHDPLLRHVWSLA
jgi:hypothetical protein